MTKVTPNPRKSAAATVGLAAIGVIAGPVPAHAADTTSFPISTNLSAVTGLLSHGGKNASALQSIPVVGALVQRVALAPDSAPPAEGDGAGRPLARSAVPTMPAMPTVPAMPSMQVMPAMQAVPSLQAMPAADPTSSSALSLTSLADLLPKNLEVARGDKESLPLRSSDSNSVNLPVLGSATSVVGLAGLL